MSLEGVSLIPTKNFAGLPLHAISSVYVLEVCALVEFASCRDVGAGREGLDGSIGGEVDSPSLAVDFLDVSQNQSSGHNMCSLYYSAAVLVEVKWQCRRFAPFHGECLLLILQCH